MKKPCCRLEPDKPWTNTDLNTISSPDFVLRHVTGSDEPAGWKALLLGAAILAVIGLIPILSVVATILTILYGFGAWTLYLYRSYFELRTAQ